MTQQEFTTRFSYDHATDLLGEGGFGRVYRAYDNYEHEYVALKIQSVDPKHPELRLKSEVAKVQHYHHKNIARYRDCYTFVDYRGETDVAVMKYYKDGGLDKLLSNNNLSHNVVYGLLTEILEGIAFLHGHGIIHRDLKPQNILIVEHGGKYSPLITDFGISKQLNEGESSAVSNSVLGGTRAYASPEQLKERSIRKNTDLWSFGVIAYQMLTGELPFNCGSYSPTSEEGRQEQFRQMTSGLLPERLNGVPEPWQRLIRECLTVDNEQRLAHAEDCLAIIHGGEATAVAIEVDNPATQLDGDSETAVEPEPQPEPKVAPEPEPKSVSASKPTEPKKSKWWLWLLLLAIVGGGGFFARNAFGFYMVGDYYNVNGVEGVVFEISDGGRHGKIVSVDQAELEWGPRDVDAPADSETNGRANTDAIMALASRDSYPAFTWCRDKGPNWYLPAIEELQAIYRNRDAINATLRARGYTEISHSWYWSSTESDKFCAWFVSMDYGFTNSINKGYDSYVRAVSAF